VGGGKHLRRERGVGFSKESLLLYIRGAIDQTSGFAEILRDFEADKTDRKQIRDILDQLVRDGQLSRLKGHRYRARARPSARSGRIQFHRDGYAFVTPNEKIPGIEGDVFIPPPATGTAMHQDEVSFTIVSRQKAEGQVVEVLRRARTRVVGQLRFDGRTWFLSPADDKLPDRILVLGDVSEHKDKLVEVELAERTSGDRWPSGEIVSVIGFLDEPDIETRVVMRKYGLESEFPPEVEEEAGRGALELTAEDLAGRTDFRGRGTVTIDPATARDFDDAVDVERLPGGGFRVGIHIADVAHFVERGTKIDIEARKRGCSVYFPDRVVPMLPERLSNEICSLNAGTDRLAMSVVLDLDPAGHVRSAGFHQSVIRSLERMNYETVQRILDGDSPARGRYHAVLDHIELLGEAARALLDRRGERGTIDFDLPEPELTYDEEGIFRGIGKSERHFSHRLIEAFMIAANEAVAGFLASKLGASIYRIHEPPDPERVAELSQTMAGMGLAFRPREATPRAFQEFMTSIEARPDARMLSYLVLRSFRQAVYSTRNRGHFGLASRVYTHFTSPIRRYPDLVVHRLLKACLAGTRSLYHETDLESVAVESSERERLADQAERDLFEWKRMIVLGERMGETLDAIVIHVFPRGMRIELVDDFIEGTIAVEDLEDDYYDFNARSRSLVGRGTRRRYQLGQKVRVRIARIDKLLGRASFLVVPEARRGGNGRSGDKGRRRKASRRR
jgi:ribonuclease R